ncbi:MAG: hypothetical protein GTO02_22565 [Candidatus Dadabacteria bacterium]|nr:hypothetical protein [Candidatus Dadabacteria bacterium]
MATPSFLLPVKIESKVEQLEKVAKRLNRQRKKNRENIQMTDQQKKLFCSTAFVKVI